MRDTGQHLRSLPDLGMVEELAAGRHGVDTEGNEAGLMCVYVRERERERSSKRLPLKNFILALRPTFS